jgi:tetratricopeptide (TPR) repeat protein
MHPHEALKPRLWPAITLTLATIVVPGCREETKTPQTQPAVSANDADAAISTAEALVSAQKWSDAESVLTALVARAPESVQGWQLLGEVLSAQALEARDRGNSEAFASLIERAAGAYGHAVELAPKNAGLHHSAAVIFDLAGRPEDALALYQRASDVEPSNTQYLLYLAQAFTRAEEYPKATAALVKLLQIDKDEPWAYACLAEIDLAEKRLDMAADHIRKARELNPDETSFRITESRILRRHGKPKDALELLLPLPEADQLTEAATFEIASGYAMLGDHEKAAQAWERCYRADPRNWRAACEAGEAFVRAKQFESAKAWLEIARLQAPDQPRVKGLESLISGRVATAPD